MIHYVLLKFEQGFSIDYVEEQFNKLFVRMPDEIEGVQSVSFKRNCVERDTNMDVMISLVLDSEQVLPVYLQHPLHVEFAANTLGHVINRVSFDERG